MHLMTSQGLGFRVQGLGIICQALPRPRDGLDESRQLREAERLVVYNFVMQRFEAPYKLRAPGEGQAERQDMIQYR
jgi:hypothetical protein